MARPQPLLLALLIAWLLPLAGCRGTAAPSPELTLGPGPAGPARLASSQPSYARRLSDAFQTVSEEVGPAVVSVRAFSRRNRRFARQQGSGVIVRVRGDKGVIVTNNHVVKDSSRFYVYLSDGRDYEAKLVGNDPATDLAVLEIEGEDLVAASLEEPDRIAVGEWVLAMGNPYGLGHTVTAGVVGGLRVSGLDIASYEDFIQTDAAINPGNSGGPLVNLDGQVVGINTAIGTESAGTVGIAYAIPVRMVRQVVDGLLAGGVVQRGWIGVDFSWLSRRLASDLGFDCRSRVVVHSTFDGGPAERGGLQEQDVLVGVGGRPVTTEAEARTLIAEAQPGRPLDVQVWRRGRLIELRVTPEARTVD